MPGVTGELLADFSDFVSEGAKASATLKGLEKGGEDVDKSLNSMVGSMKGMALSLASAFGVAFSLDAVVNFGREIVDTAGALMQLSTKTGVSVEELQRMEAAGLSAGVSVESLASASYKLGIAIEGGEASVVGALAQLGIAYADIARMSPEQQFQTAIRALEGLESQTEKNRLGQELFGRSWEAIAPAIVKGYSDIAAGAEVSTRAQVEAIDRAAAAWDGFVAARKRDAVSLAGSIVLATDEFGKLGLKEQALIALQTLFGNSTVGVTTALGALNAMSQQRAEQLAFVGPLEEKAVGLTKAQAEAATKHTAAMQELNAVGTGWAGTLATINGDTVEAIKFYLEAGVSQTTLATAYGLTAAQVKAVASATQDATKATAEWQAIEKTFAAESAQHFKEQATETARVLKLRNQAVLEGNAAIMAASATLHDYEMKQSMDTSTYQIMKIWERADAEIRAFQGTAQQAQQHADLVYSIAAIEAQGITDVMASALDQMFGKAQSVLQATKDEATTAVESMQQYSMVGGQQLTQEQWDAYYQTPAGIADIIRNHGKRYFAGAHGAELRAEGGPVVSGSPYLVGERGPELFVPQSSGSILPGAGGVTIVNHITQPLGDPGTIARVVGDAVMRSLRAGGSRLPV